MPVPGMNPLVMKAMLAKMMQSRGAMPQRPMARKPGMANPLLMKMLMAKLAQAGAMPGAAGGAAPPMPMMPGAMPGAIPGRQFGGSVTGSGTDTTIPTPPLNLASAPTAAPATTGATTPATAATPDLTSGLAGGALAGFMPFSQDSQPAQQPQLPSLSQLLMGGGTVNPADKKSPTAGIYGMLENMMNPDKNTSTGTNFLPMTIPTMPSDMSTRGIASVPIPGRQAGGPVGSPAMGAPGPNPMQGLIQSILSNPQLMQMIMQMIPQMGGMGGTGIPGRAIGGLVGGDPHTIAGEPPSTPVPNSKFGIPSMAQGGAVTGGTAAPTFMPYPGFPVGARALGGPVGTPNPTQGMYTVGEAGPELLMMSPGSQGHVVPLPNTIKGAVPKPKIGPAQRPQAQKPAMPPMRPAPIRPMPQPQDYINQAYMPSLAQMLGLQGGVA